jgi:p-hydroxybenzoate 3-monooxygenase
VQAPLALILKTQVAIIGGGPSGLLLGQLLLRQGIDTVILERRTRAHVLSRIRAGVLERGLVDLLREAGVADRLEREGIRHDGTLISFDDEMFRVDFAQATGHAVTVYGQTEVTRDLYAAREAAGAQDRVRGRGRGDPRRDGRSALRDLPGGRRGAAARLRVRRGLRRLPRRQPRRAFPDRHPPRIREGLSLRLARHPVRDAAGQPELIYANSERGFALCSMRNENLSRYYIQCPLTDTVEDWSDEPSGTS